MTFGKTLKTKAARLIAFTGFIALTTVGFYYWQQSQPLPIPHHLQGLGGDFVLHSADGPIDLHDFRGKVVLLYFGYMNCPDVCPLTMSNWTEVFNQLGDAEMGKVRGLLVSVDSNIIGATGNYAELSEVTMLYRADYSLEHKGKNDEYVVDHTSFVYVIDPLGKLRSLLVHDSSSKDILKGIRNSLKVTV